MSELPWPVRKVLRTGIDDVALARIGQRINRRRCRSARGTRPELRALSAIGGALTVVALLSLAVLTLTHRRKANPVTVGPLRLATGAPLGAMAAVSNAAQTFALSDGSSILLRSGSRLDVLENDAKAIVVLLTSGFASFEVQPGGPRRWVIECGLVTVEVVGTRFSVRRNGSAVRVEVQHGVVLVRGDPLPDRIRRMTDGEFLEVNWPVDSALRTDNPTENFSSGPPPSRSAGSGSRVGRWQEIARQGDYAAAYGLLGPSGVRHVYEVGGVQDLLAVADVARLSGHPRDAVAPLKRIVADHTDDPSAALAAFTLGRVQLDALEDPADAADAFARAIALGVPQGLLEDACARLVEARARAGDEAGARRSAADYAKRFPQGARASEVARWASPP